ncbi:hypothetical protein [Ostreibacterium oceani]|uniref:Thioredoxin n=1 Tax=Ostreibacterium oceani TaxID=2654998 RepID=A0A6N7F1Q8_9GAMM|nr:hypothetical protein [Ostreibacterium oceani]MPV86728.1 hypothetical protein [Ostreibacterium oceani]
MATLENLTAENLSDFLAAPKSILILGKTDCPACQEWGEEIDNALAGDALNDTIDQGWRFGKLLINQKGLLDFKKNSPWLADVDTLPYNVIYVDGEIKKKYSGGGLDRLLTRLSRI